MMRYGLAMLSVAFIAGCGGGGGGGNGNTSSGDLQVNFSGYQATPATMYKAVSFAPSVSDLNGNRPSYRVASGSLPPGLSLDPNTGVISGVLAGPGTSSASVELSVQGFSGSLPVTFSMTVDPTSLSYTGSSGSIAPTPATTFSVGAPLPTFRAYLLDRDFYSNGSYGLGPLDPAAGVTVTYRVANGSALPAGLALEPTTGVISGTPTTTGVVNTQVEATATLAGATQTFAATIPFSVTTPTATLAYKPTTINGDLCISASSGFPAAAGGGTAVTFTPVLTGTQPGDVVSNFTATPAAALGNLTLDPNTGVISGTSNAADNFCGVAFSQFDVSYTLTRGSYSTQLSRHFLFLQ